MLMTISSVLTRTTTAYLTVIGAVTLFAADAVLPALIPAFPPSALFLGQLIAGGWLAMAAMNWQHRAQMLGGIYGRPIVYANLLMFTITALGVLRAANAPAASPWLWAIVAPCGLLAVMYALLMFRGPFDKMPAQISTQQDANADRHSVRPPPSR